MEINTWSLYSINSCTSFTGGQCIQWTNIQQNSIADYVQIGTTILFDAFVMVLVLQVVWRIFKVLFARFFWWKK